MLRDPELRDACTERCETSLLECILECSNDTACLTNCIRLETECINGKSYEFEHLSLLKDELESLSDCPCENNCLEGCEDCSNPVCECKDKRFYKN